MNMRVLEAFVNPDAPDNGSPYGKVWPTLTPEQKRRYYTLRVQTGQGENYGEVMMPATEWAAMVGIK